MMKPFFFLVLVFATCSIVSAAPRPDDYSISVHVTSSRWEVRPGLSGPQSILKLAVNIDGKKFELEGSSINGSAKNGVPLLALGDYKARLLRDEHKTSYESAQVYEFLLPDKKVRKFVLVGMAE